jgi:F0F1-type ATP synthase membrane subunit b/b'
MPQFDTFSFLSQLFWVITCFLILYLNLTYYVLPAVATVLKVRSRKTAANKSIATEERTNPEYSGKIDASLVKLINNCAKANESLNEFCKAAPQELNLVTDALLVKTVASRGVEIEIKTTLQTQKLNFVKNVTVLKT